MIKVCELPMGCVVWYKNDILGISGVSVPTSFNGRCCRKLPGNPFDWEIVDDK